MSFGLVLTEPVSTCHTMLLLLLPFCYWHKPLVKVQLVSFKDLVTVAQENSANQTAEKSMILSKSIEMETCSAYDIAHELARMSQQMMSDDH